MKYKRVLLKLSGESLMGDKNFGISPNMLVHYSKQIKAISDLGVEVAVVMEVEISSEAYKRKIQE